MGALWFLTDPEEGEPATRNLLAAGLLAGLLGANRLPDLAFTAAFGLYALLRARRRAGWFAAAAAVPLLATLAYNLAVFRSPIGGYGAALVVEGGFFNHPVWTGVAGLLVSPGRGIFVYSPVLPLPALRVSPRPGGSQDAGPQPRPRGGDRGPAPLLRPLGLAGGLLLRLPLPHRPGAAADLAAGAGVRLAGPAGAGRLPRLLPVRRLCAGDRRLSIHGDQRGRDHGSGETRGCATSGRSRTPPSWSRGGRGGRSSCCCARCSTRSGAGSLRPCAPRR